MSVTYKDEAGFKLLEKEYIELAEKMSKILSQAKELVVIDEVGREGIEDIALDIFNDSNRLDRLEMLGIDIFTIVSDLTNRDK